MSFSDHVAPPVVATLGSVRVPVAVVTAVRREVMPATIVAALDQMVAIETMIVAILERWRGFVVAVVVPAAGRKASKRDRGT